MKTLRRLFLLPLLIPILAGCYNDVADVVDGGIWDRLNEHEERLTALEEWQQQVNDNISALQQLLNTADYITAVTPVEQGGRVIGYTISFRNSDPITIYHGEKGEQGEQGEPGEPGEPGKPGTPGADGDDATVPTISIVKGTDGNWYWTLNGDYILDQNGDPVRANGEKGEPGDDGQPGTPGTPGSEGQPGQPGTSAPVPQLYTGSYLGLNLGITTDAEGNALVADAIYLSVDGGATWHRVSGEKGDTGDTGATGSTGATGATGPKGDSMFEKAPVVDKDAGTVGFFLEGNTTDTPDFTLPLYVGMSITFTDETVAMPLPGGTLALNLTVTGETATTELRAIAPEGWEAQLTAGTAKGAYVLTLTAPARGLLDLGADCSGRVFVTMNDGHGSSTMAEKEVYCVFFTVDTKSSITDGSYSYQGRTLQIGITEGSEPVVLAESAPIGADGIVHFGNNYLVGLAVGDEVWFCIPGVVKFFHKLTQAEVEAGEITLPDKDKGSTVPTGSTENDWIVALYMGINKNGLSFDYGSVPPVGTHATDVPVYWASGNLIAVGGTQPTFRIASYEETVEEAKSTGTVFIPSTGGNQSKWDTFGWGDPTGLKTSTQESDYNKPADYTNICGDPTYDICRAGLGGTWRLPNSKSNALDGNEWIPFSDANTSYSGAIAAIEPNGQPWCAEGCTSKGTSQHTCGRSYSYTIPGTDITNTLIFPAVSTSRGKIGRYWTSYFYTGGAGCYWFQFGHIYGDEHKGGGLGGTQAYQRAAVRPVTE